MAGATSATALPPGGIGPELPESLDPKILPRTSRSSKRGSNQLEAQQPKPKVARSSGAQVAPSCASTKPCTPSGLTGIWMLHVQRPAVSFKYELAQLEDQSVAGWACAHEIGQSHRSQVAGQLQGYVLIWTEDGHGKFRATLAADGQSFSGTAQLDAAISLEFQALRLPEQQQGEGDHEYVFTHDGESLRCSKQLLEEHIPKLLQMVSTAGPISSSDLLKSCPLEAAVHSRLLPLLRALGNPQGHVTVHNAVHILSLADWLGCADATLQALAGAVSTSLVPDMLRAAGSEEAASVELVLQRNLLIYDTEAIEALVKDEQKSRWTELCGPAVLRCLRRLSQTDPEGLRLSRAASAAIALGLPLKEVHTAMPSRLRFGPGAKNLFLDLHKRGIGPEGAARLEFPSGLRDLDLDLTRCNIRAVGAAALRFPSGLQRLRLILHKCDIGPEGAKALSLPSSLERLEMDLSHCLIGPIGATHLQLPRGLLELDLVLLRCGIGAKGAKALSLPDGLQTLRLDLAKCELGVEGLKGLKLPPRLTSLNLDLTMNALGLDAIKAFLLALPKSLEALEMTLTGCKIPAAQISQLQQVARRRLTNVTSPNFVT